MTDPKTLVAQAAQALIETIDNNNVGENVHNKVQQLRECLISLVAAQPGQGEREAPAPDAELWQHNIGILSTTHKTPEQATRTQPPAQPEGWVMVPREPTEAMVRNSNDLIYSMSESHVSYLKRLYAAMLAATPQAPGADKGEAMEKIRKDFAEIYAAKDTDGSESIFASAESFEAARRIDALLNPEKE